jgi:hypothetical protein
MGVAVLHCDLPTIEARNPFSEELTNLFWPNYPEDILLIEVRPVWLEVMGLGIATSDDTWRPQAVVIEDIGADGGS